MHVIWRGPYSSSEGEDVRDMDRTSSSSGSFSMAPFDSTLFTKCCFHFFSAKKRDRKKEITRRMTGVIFEEEEEEEEEDDEAG